MSITLPSERGAVFWDRRGDSPQNGQGSQLHAVQCERQQDPRACASLLELLLDVINYSWIKIRNSVSIGCLLSLAPFIRMIPPPVSSQHLLRTVIDAWKVFNVIG
jgi:hypothetical protein